MRRTLFGDKLMNDTDSNAQTHEESPFKGKTGLPRLLNAFGYSLEGFKAAFKHEDAFRQEVFFAVVLIPLAFFLEAEALHRVLMIGSVFLVLIVELLNSAVEAAVDRVSIERHALAKRAKDIGSAAVFVALTNVVMTWGLILLT
ncbi:MAG: diacylglycerol kinase (ATP) [Methylophilaceae bacterium]|jgi:diacylglycerol kinase (ATP)|tara:strand:- start:20485 stop:20916 length:432 start_codon:yes stop_codon:yes gene_type:complete